MRNRDDGIGTALLVVVFFLIAIVGVVVYRNHVESDCKALGGHVKWWYGGKNTPDNYMCLSSDGRILG